jgi:CRP-like cAMP-binding protein
MNPPSDVGDKEFRVSQYLRNNSVGKAKKRSATVSHAKNRSAKAVSFKSGRMKPKSRPKSGNLKYIKSSANVLSSLKTKEDLLLARKSGLNRGFTYSSGLSVNKVVTSEKGTSHLLRFLGKLQSEDRITSDERVILREAIMKGHAHTIRVLTQMNSFSLGASADKVLTNLLDDVISQSISVGSTVGKMLGGNENHTDGEKKQQNRPSNLTEVALVHGVLYKKRAFGLFVPRYFVLVDDEFRYYDARTGKKLIDGKMHYSDVKAKGTYPHNEYITIRDVANQKFKNCFELQVDEKKTLILKAKDRNEKQLWLTAIAEWIVGGGKVRKISPMRVERSSNGNVTKTNKREYRKVKTYSGINSTRSANYRKQKMPVSKKHSVALTVADASLSSYVDFEHDVTTMVLASATNDCKAIFEGTLLYRDDQSDRHDHKWIEIALNISEKEIRLSTPDNINGMNIKIGLNSKLKLRVSARNDFQFSISPMKSRKTYTFLAANKNDYTSWVNTFACAIKRAGKQWSMNKRKSIVLLQGIAENNISSSASVDLPSSATSAKPFASEEKPSDYNDTRNTMNNSAKQNGVHNSNSARRLGGSKVKRSWDIVRKHVNKDNNAVERGRAMTTLQPHANTKGVKRSVSSSLDFNDAPGVTMEHANGENQVDEDKSDNSYKTRNSIKSRRHSTNTLGTYQGKRRDFKKLHRARKEGWHAFATLNGTEEFNALWDRLYDNNDDDDLENDVESLSFEQRVLVLSSKNKEKNKAHKTMLKNAIRALKKSTASASKLSSSLFNRIDQHGIDQLVDEMFLVDVPSNCTVIEKGATGELFYIVEAGRFIPSSEDIDTFASSLTSQSEKKKDKADLERTPQIVVRSKRHSAITSSFRQRGNKRIQVGAGPGDCFGHEALFHEAPRGATVSTGNLPGMLWVLSKQQFQDIARQSMKRKGLLKRRAMRFVPLLKQFLDTSELKALSKCAEDEFARAGEFLLYRKAPEKLYIILRGVVEVTEKHVDTGAEKCYHATVTEYVGLESILAYDNSFVKNNSLIVTMRAVEKPVQCMALTLDDIEEVLGNEERLNSFIAYIKSNYDDKQTSILSKASDGLRRKTAYKEKALRQSHSNSISNATFSKNMKQHNNFKKATRNKRFSMQSQPGAFRYKRRSILVAKPNPTPSVEKTTYVRVGDTGTNDGRTVTAESSHSQFSPKRNIHRRRRSNFIQSATMEVARYSLAADDDSCNIDTSSERDLSSPSVVEDVQRPGSVDINNTNDDLTDVAGDSVSSIPSPTQNEESHIVGDNIVKSPCDVESLSSPPLSPAILAKEGDNVIVSPFNTSNVSTSPTNSTTKMDDIPRVSTATDYTDADDTESDESDDDYDNKDLPWDDGVYLSPDIKLEDLTVHKTLGHGAFSKVKLVSAKYDFFALKCMERIYIVENDCQDMIDNELAALKELNGSSKFVMGLHGAFATEKMIFFLTELCPGGELYGHIREQENGVYLEKDAIFYAACVIEGLSAIHQKKIVYRDLKMENLIIDEIGYLKIVDFGLAKKTEKTFTSCGTPEYMSPEMILSSGHNFCADYWAFGILLFELVNGVTPFAGYEVMETYENILEHKNSRELPYKKIPAISKNFKRLVRALLKKRPSRRLGHKGIGDILNSPFFSEFPFDELRERRLPAPFLPSMAMNNDGGETEAEEEEGHLVLLDQDWKDVIRERSGWQPNI